MDLIYADINFLSRLMNLVEVQYFFKGRLARGLLWYDEFENM
jgi:hypothetical protein